MRPFQCHVSCHIPQEYLRNRTVIVKERGEVSRETFSPAPRVPPSISGKPFMTAPAGVCGGRSGGEGMRSLHSAIVRQLIRHHDFVNLELIPFFRSCHPFTVKWLCANYPPALQRCILSLSGMLPDAATNRGTTLLPPAEFRSIIRDGTKQGDIAVGMQSAHWLNQLRERARHRPLTSNAYAFNVGDVVVHKRFGHVGVVAARLPTCFESDEWIHQHLGHFAPPLMKAPWYLVLLGKHDGLPLDFSRYASELTHERVRSPTRIGMNRYLPLFFEGFDADAGTYRLRQMIPLSPLSPPPNGEAPSANNDLLIPHGGGYSVGAPFRPFDAPPNTPSPPPLDGDGGGMMGETDDDDEPSAGA